MLKKFERRTELTLNLGLVLQEVLIAYNNSKEVYEGFGYFGTFFTTAAPFLYCLTVRFLVQYPQKWNNYYLAAFAAASCECCLLFETKSCDVALSSETGVGCDFVQRHAWGFLRRVTVIYSR